MGDAFDLDRVGGSRFLDGLVSEICAAGEEALRLFAAGAANWVRRKPDRSPVTEADEAVEKRLRNYLARTCPDAAFLGEETGATPEGLAGLRFIVDPIDGTRAFVRGLDTWSILVGLEAYGEPVLGVALLPALRDLYVGVLGAGATKNGRPVRVSEVEHLEDAGLAHGGLLQFTEAGLADLLPALAESTYAQRGGLDFHGHAMVIEGRCDAMVDPDVKPWDICAVMPIVEEAGGRFTDFSGAATVHGGGALSTNGRVHDELLALLSLVKGSEGG